ncbi:PadR family transcriptional regulator [Pantanalinema sp. GBBB05]|uniref:PadR family transcriptional regulator n=1 Tax=Pantanalinema sp. GBBB05 TaxID=2604139 RepID=UPI001DB366CE|nr:PadR family transcriptional regulator [Pantanalinema sp. GBBB05]
MQLEDIYTFFETRSPIFLNPEVTVCYILHTLLQNDVHGTELIQHLEQHHPSLRVSDVVLYLALKFLEREELIVRYVEPMEEQNQPRQMFRLVPEACTRAQDLAQLWERFVTYR